jgi:hypothetical protein
MPLLYRLYPEQTLSIEQLRHALELILANHLSLRTSLIFNTESKQLMQKVIDLNDTNRELFTFIESTFETDEQLNDIIHNEKCNSQLFNLSEGLVFRCHLVHHNQISSNDLLTEKDVIIFNFHHSSFDYPSMNIFLYDLDRAYITGQLTSANNTTIRYLDCKYEYFVEYLLHHTSSPFFVQMPLLNNKCQ